MLISVVFTVLLVALDQLTKYLATLYLKPVGTMPFLPGIMELRYVLNDGAAFSILAGNQAFLIAVTSVALVALAAYFFVRRPSSLLERAAFVLVFAGGVGNLIDRVLNGYVVDFFATTFMNFAVFNVADCFVCVGMGLFIVSVLRAELREKRQRAPAQGLPAEGDDVQSAKNGSGQQAKSTEVPAPKPAGGAQGADDEG